MRAWNASRERVRRSTPRRPWRRSASVPPSCAATRREPLSWPVATKDASDYECRRWAWRSDLFMSGGGDHTRHLLLALTATACGRTDDARRELATAAAM